ncbi:MAG TPA: TadE/TadG family type IV pilus assembly protein [Allosphingosinicella sp.]|jgi:Flp pilus assembly protein TadG
MAPGPVISAASMERRRGIAASICAVARRLRGDRRGVSMLEFALFFPILALIVLGTIDMAKGLAVKFALDQATQRTVELAALAGRPQADYTYLETEARTAANVPAANVTVRPWLECNGRTEPFGGSCAAGEQAARYVSVTIFKDYAPMFTSIPFVHRFAGANGTIRITAASGVRVQ